MSRVFEKIIEDVQSHFHPRDQNIRSINQKIQELDRAIEELKATRDQLILNRQADFYKLTTALETDFND